MWEQLWTLNEKLELESKGEWIKSNGYQRKEPSGDGVLRIGVRIGVDNILAIYSGFLSCYTLLSTRFCYTLFLVTLLDFVLIFFPLFFLLQNRYIPIVEWCQFLVDCGKHVQYLLGWRNLMCRDDMQKSDMLSMSMAGYRLAVGGGGLQVFDNC